MATKKKSVAKGRGRSAEGQQALGQRAAKAALDRATKAIKALRRSASKNAWAIGRRLGQVAELQLHKARGFGSLEEYAEAVLGLSRDTAFLYMRVAAAFGESMVETFGAEKLDRALRYIAATPEKEEPSDIPTLMIRVPPEDGGEPVHKAFERTSIAELRRAVQHERAAGKPHAKNREKAAWLPDEAAQRIEKGHVALDAALGRAAARSADVTVRRAGTGALIDVRGVPLDRAADAFRALAAAMRP